MPITTRLRSGAGARKNYRSLAGMKPRRSVTRRVTKPAAKAIRAIAKSVVRKETEDKFVSTEGSVAFNSTISSASDCYALVPQVTVGTGDYQRIGDKIRGKYLYLKGHVQLKPEYFNGLNGTQYMPPFTARVLVLSQKNIKVGSDVNSRVDTAHLLKDNVGTGTARAYTAQIVDNLAPINRDLFKVHMDRKIRFSWVTKSTNDIATDNSYGVGQERTKYFSCRIKCPATMYFDDGNGSWANNFAPFLTFGAVSDDGTLPFSVSTPYRVTWLATMYYEDA